LIRFSFPSCVKASFFVLIDRLDSFLTDVAVKAYQKARPAHKTHGQSAPDIYAARTAQKDRAILPACLPACLPEL